MKFNVKTLQKQIVGQPKVVGKLDGEPVLYVLVKGGLSMLYTAKANGDMDLKGVGSHRQIAKAVALQRNPKMEITELSKSDEIPVAADIMNRYVPEYSALLDRIKKLIDQK